jgi:superfamily I DNA and RNA helicase
MVSQKMIKAYDFETIQDYYDYVLLSEINGQRQQVYSLVKSMSKEQKKECLAYLKENTSGSDSKIVQNILLETL